MHKLVTFNLRFGSANDGPNSWEFRRSVFYNNIKALEPDVMGTQEGLEWQLNEILFGIGPRYSYVGQGRDGGNTGEYCAIFYNNLKYEELQHGSFWLSDTPNIPSRSWDSNLNRICTWVELRIMNTNDSFFIYNTHLDWESSISRDLSIPVILEHIGQKKLEEDKVIVMGDFNSNSDSKPCQILRKHGFTDSFESETKVNTFHCFNGKGNGGKIDFIWIKKRDFSVHRANIDQYNENGRYPSDHYAITTTLVLNK
eukprot:NODE_50_length_27150_cov_0.307308.p10 type:complete len:255 gc:universal NODE_50_length_27150_cov_0.307308:24414-25178(+)